MCYSYRDHKGRRAEEETRKTLRQNAKAGAAKRDEKERTAKRDRELARA